MKVSDFMAVFNINKDCKIEFEISPLFEMMASLRSCYLNKGGSEKVLITFYKKIIIL